MIINLCHHPVYIMIIIIIYKKKTKSVRDGQFLEAKQTELDGGEPMTIKKKNTIGPTATHTPHCKGNYQTYTHFFFGVCSVQSLLHTMSL